MSNWLPERRLSGLRWRRCWRGGGSQSRPSGVAARHHAARPSPGGDEPFHQLGELLGLLIERHMPWLQPAVQTRGLRGHRRGMGRLRSAPGSRRRGGERLRPGIRIRSLLGGNPREELRVAKSYAVVGPERLGVDERAGHPGLVRRQLRDLERRIRDAQGG
jgi:hypothetical protein